MMERIKEIWGQLENNTSPVTGLSKQRYSDTSRCDAYLGIKYPESFRMLILKTPFAIGHAFQFKYEFKGLKFEKVYDADDSNFLLLNLVIVDRQYKDVFDSLIADVLNSIIAEVDLKIILKNYTNRLLKWQSLFEQFNPQGLTPEEQRGLYGELFFIRKFLLINSDFINVINSWVGPEQQIKDFQSGTWSVEVKTTHGNNHQKVHIANERQLDTSNLEHLFLYHLSLEARQQSGETLNQLVNIVFEILGSDFASLSRFKNKLLEAGYFGQHTSLYESTGYFIRDDVFYKVENDFPRIEENNIRDGVGDVKYTIILSHCSPYTLSEQEVFQTVIF